MTQSAVTFLILVLGMAGFLWLGLYSISRGDGRRIPTLTGIAALLTTCFFLFGASLAVQSDPAIVVAMNRISWWANVLPVAVWFHLSVDFNPHITDVWWRRPALWAAYGGGALLVLLGTGTDLLTNYVGGAHLDASSSGHLRVGTGSAYIVYVIYVFVLTSCAALNFQRMYRHNTGGVTKIVPAPDSVAARRTDQPSLSGQTPDSPGDNPGDSLGHVLPAAQPKPTTAARLSQDRVGTGRRLLVAGAICFLLGVGSLTVIDLTRAQWTQLPSYLLLLAGLGAVGGSVVVQGALLIGKDVHNDVVYSLTGLVILLGPFLIASGVLVGFDSLRPGLLVILLTLLITIGHTLQDTVRQWLDHIFFPPVVVEERAAARVYEEALATQPSGTHPDLGTIKAFDDAVRRALTHLSDPTKLATTPLLNLHTVAAEVAAQSLEDNRLNRAAVLKEILLDLLEGLRPTDRPDGRTTGDAWRFYNCLYYPYVRGIGRRRTPTVLRQLAERRKRDNSPRSDLENVLEWLLQVDEDTFYKWQRRGSDTIAAALRDRELAAGGTPPTEKTI